MVPEGGCQAGTRSESGQGGGSHPREEARGQHVSAHGPKDWSPGGSRGVGGDSLSEPSRLGPRTKNPPPGCKDPPRGVPGASPTGRARRDAARSRRQPLPARDQAASAWRPVAAQALPAPGKTPCGLAFLRVGATKGVSGVSLPRVLSGCWEPCPTKQREHQTGALGYGWEGHSGCPVRPPAEPRRWGSAAESCPRVWTQRCRDSVTRVAAEAPPRCMDGRPAFSTVEAGGLRDPLQGTDPICVGCDPSPPEGPPNSVPVGVGPHA